MNQEQKIREAIAQAKRIGREQDKRDRQMGLGRTGMDWSWPESWPHPLIILGILAMLVLLCGLAVELPSLFGVQ